MLSKSQIYEFEKVLIDILKSDQVGLRPEILKILPFLLGGLKVVKSDDIRELFSNSSYKKLYPIFEGALGEQAKLILNMVKKSRSNTLFFKENIISEKTNGEIFINIFLTMIRNLETFASMVFDINVINKILVSRSKRMIVYAGINHVNRISALLTNNDDVSMIGANRSGVFLHLMPILSAIMAMVFFSEKFMFYHILGACFIITGILLSNKKVKNA